jgi:hypothetical protein
MAIAGFDYQELPKPTLSVKASKICSYTLDDNNLLEFLKGLSANLDSNKRRSFLGEIKKLIKNKFHLDKLDKIYLSNLLKSSLLLHLIYMPHSQIDYYYCHIRTKRLLFSINEIEINNVLITQITFYEYNLNGLESF